MFTVSVEMQFKASHSVCLSDGSQEPRHEHFWGVSAEVSTAKLGDHGVAVDFALLKSKLTEIISKLSGATLNDIDSFRDTGPTAESVAAYVFERLEPNLPNDVRLENVTVSEQVGCWARYSKGS